jgi:hypothetical protein
VCVISWLELTVLQDTARTVLPFQHLRGVSTHDPAQADLKEMFTLNYIGLTSVVDPDPVDPDPEDTLASRIKILTTIYQIFEET